MTNALAIKTLSLKTGKKPEREMLSAMPLIDSRENIHRLINRRFKIYYAKKGWWWSGLWDPTAKNRRMIESIETLFEKMSRKTYEEKHTEAKKEEVEAEYKFFIHSQNIEIEAHVFHSTYSDEEQSKTSSDKKNDKKSEQLFQDNIIDLIFYKGKNPKKQQETVGQNITAIPEFAPRVNSEAPTESGERLVKIKIIRVNPVQEDFVQKVKNPEQNSVEDANISTCTTSEAAQIIASLISKTAKNISPVAEKPVEISIGTIARTAEIFIEEAAIIPQTTASPVFQSTDLANTEPPVLVQMPQPALPIVHPVSIQNASPQSNSTSRDPEIEEIPIVPVATQTTAQATVSNILFFPALPQQRIDIEEIKAAPITAQKIDAQEIQMMEEVAVVAPAIIFIPSPVPTNVPLTETIMANDPKPQQKNPESSGPTSNSNITVFFAKTNNSARLKQTDAEAAPEE